MHVEKWQALGNHFALVERAGLPWSLSAARARLLCDPALGLGADGVLEVFTGEGADVSVVVWNADGGIAEISGNGTRIAAAHAARARGLREVTVATGAGTGRARVLPDGRIAVTLGSARLDGSQYAPNGDDPGLAHRFVSVGNPHCVVMVDDVESFPLTREGPRLEHHAWFPERTNVEVVHVLARDRLRMRVWERGVGETRACGSGACASAVAAVVDGRCASPVRVEMPGGMVEVEVAADLSLTLTGTAERVYTAVIDTDLAERLRAAT